MSGYERLLCLTSLSSTYYSVLVVVPIKFCVIHLRMVKLVVFDMFQSNVSYVIWRL